MIPLFNNKVNRNQYFAQCGKQRIYSHQKDLFKAAYTIMMISRKICEKGELICGISTLCRCRISVPLRNVIRNANGNIESQ